MPSTQVQILKVEGHSGTSKAGKAYTRYDVDCADGRTYSTFNAQLAGTAQGLVGQLATIEYEERVNGKFTNLDLNGISTTVSAGSAKIDAIVSSPIPVVAAPKAESQDERQASIVRQSSLKTAFEYAAAAGESVEFAKNLADVLVSYASTGSWPVEATEPVLVD